ncbi:unnamed protein product [Linum tenue]|uniref:DNA helicase Pif1-like 2B domain-containing protein n=1 Tax=Linum tenue TaxID=586396 RepID=A0AAV0QBS1_9ROSI|nr:unnamed protein product [Linum tenue]CAI0541528.1 unnamed protein product [Linum tenue]CAI0541764.1 unnamed protein product [Linum tenue]CAI0545641.1 unnamed protein product [Linum tenue]
MGSLLPAAGQRPKYSQLYVFDPQTELADRLSNFSSAERSLRPDIVSGLMKLFDVTNELVKSFRRIRSELNDPASINLRLRIVGARDTTSRQYELPTGSELAGLIPGDFLPDKEERDIIIDHRSEGLKRITSVHPKFDALHFPVLFPYGEDGFHGNVPGKSFPSNQSTDWIEIPESLLLPSSGNPIHTITSTVYPDFAQRFHNVSYLTERSIITPTNANVTEINSHMLALIPGMPRTYFSGDSLHTDASDPDRLEAEYPTEFLNSLSFNGCPEHQIDLKVFAPIMLLRNLNPSIGLCNGTRLMVLYLGHYVIKGMIMGGTFNGKTVAIPRIVLSVNDYRWPFVLKRRQFPVRLCYAMTINKSQGQTLQNVGVYLPKPVFSHGQLYVAVSRVRTPDGLRFLIMNEDGVPSNCTRNIVYQEAFVDLQTPSS